MTLDLTECPPAARSVDETVTWTGCCVVGGGPGGLILALLLARRGIDVTVLEAHSDFEREFRGDTVHPSTLELMKQLHLYDQLVQLPHGTFSGFRLHTSAGITRWRSFGATARSSEYLMLPQARFLEFIVQKASRYPTFHLILTARVEQLVEEHGVVCGVHYSDRSGRHELRAPLVVGADGRFSKVRQLIAADMIHSAQPIDIVSFRLPRRHIDPEDEAGIYARDGQVLVVAGRADEWRFSY